MDEAQARDSGLTGASSALGGVRRLPPQRNGCWALSRLSVELASLDAALHLCPQHVVLETAAIDLAAQLVGTDELQMQSWHVMFLARGKSVHSG